MQHSSNYAKLGDNGFIFSLPMGKKLRNNFCIWNRNNSPRKLGNVVSIPTNSSIFSRVFVYLERYIERKKERKKGRKKGRKKERKKEKKIIKCEKIENSAYDCFITL